MLIELLLGITVLILILYYYTKPDKRIYEYGNKLPGPKPYPIIGNLLDISADGAEGIRLRTEMVKVYGHVTRIWLGPHCLVVLSNPEDVEIIFTSMEHLSKTVLYDMLHPWLGTGLLTSTDEKWHKRRKALTPTFHFKILEQFIDVFNRCGNILLNKLEEKSDNKTFDVHPLISRYTLDVICETAMGVQVNAQEDPKSRYVTAVRRISKLIFKRMNKPWLFNNILFILSGYGFFHYYYLKILHKFTNKVIDEKIVTNYNKQKRLSIDEQEQLLKEKEIGIKRRTAFLELLLNMSESNQTFKSNEDIREEVDTFMFEGHDTTSSAICSTLMMLGKHSDVQEKVYEEICDILQDSNDINYQHFNDLKYLECVIKETLRLYPSVPIIGRKINKDVKITNGLILPAGSEVGISMYFIHRHTKHWKNPEEFNPDNFLPDNSVNRHPFAYVPFSAGPRNCIGQKFAMMELKSVLAKIVKNYRINYAGPESDIIINPTLILQSANGFHLKLEKRN